MKCLIAATVLLSAVVLHAQPQINNVGGDLLHMQQFTVQGLGFGAKNPAAPMVYDNFEGGTPGERIGGGWYTASVRPGYEPRYTSDVVRRPGGQSSYQSFRDGNYNSTLGLTHLDSQDFYVSGWFFNTTGGAPSRNVKLFSMRGGASGSWDLPNLRTDLYPTPSGGHIYAADCDGSLVAQDWRLSNNLYSDAWHRMEAWVDLDSEYTLSRDGDVWATISGQLHGTGCQYNNMYLMAYFATDQGDPRPWMDFYWDELYIDNTRARIELGDASTWSACTHREIQIPEAWSATSLTATLNQGSFADGQTVYVYVVDENGVRNAEGYAVTLGDSFPADELPSISIAAPSTEPVLEITEQTLELSGVASDDAGIVSVIWENDRTGNGTATNVSGDWSAWSVADVPLLEGENNIRVVAIDTAAQITEDTLRVTYTPPDPGPPGEPGQPSRSGS